MAETKSAGPPTSEPLIFALEAFEHVAKDRIAAYEAMGAAIDPRVKETEPGMLVHALTKISEDENEALYRWLEVFENPEALRAHIDNPLIKAHAEKLADGILSGRTDMVIYAGWDEAQKSYWRGALAGVNLVFAEMNTGFFVQR